VSAIVLPVLGAGRQTVATPDQLSYLGLNPAGHDQLRRALGAANDTELATKVQTLQEIATKEFVDWLLGRHRYVTIAESDADRVLRIFRDIRKESPTIATLANDLGLSPGRAASIASRLRYGEGQSFEALRYGAARQAIASQLSTRPKNSDGRQSLYLTPDVSDIIMQVAATIMLDTARHAKGAEWEGAEMAEEQRKRGLAIVTASSRMWSLIQKELDRRSNTTDVR
jgi:hypothetical protein